MKTRGEKTVFFGDGVFFNRNCSITCYNKVVIGDNTIFGENVKIYDHNHRFNIPNQLIKNSGYSYGKVLIGSNCWIGSNVTLLKGAEIGNNCVIGAGCVINSKIPSNTIVTSTRELKIQRIRYNK